MLVTGATEDAAFEREGRPRLLGEYIRFAYDRDLVPQYWKIEGVPDAAAMRVIDEAIGQREGPRQLILGKGAGLETVGVWFESARGARTAAGFAIGRTVYWRPACEFLLGRMAADDAVHEMAALTILPGISKSPPGGLEAIMRPKAGPHRRSARLRRRTRRPAAC